MSWLIVVAVLILGAIALHFGEKAKERAKRLARERAGSRHEVSFTRDVREQWFADLRAMTLQVSRVEAGAPAAPAEHLGLLRDAGGAWSVASSAIELPTRLAEQLEQRFQGMARKTPSIPAES